MSTTYDKAAAKQIATTIIEQIGFWDRAAAGWVSPAVALPYMQDGIRGGVMATIGDAGEEAEHLRRKCVIQLTAADLYDVQVYEPDGSLFGEWSNVYADGIGEIVVNASFTTSGRAAEWEGEVA